MSRKMMRWLVILISMVILAACSGSSELSVKNAWIRPTVLEGGNTGGFMTIVNNSGQDDALIGAKADFAGAVEIHETVNAGNDVMQMQHVDRIPIAHSETVELKPGGYHIMFIGTTAELKAGDSAKLTLVFENAGEISLDVSVEDR